MDTTIVVYNTVKLVSIELRFFLAKGVNLSFLVTFQHIFSIWPHYNVLNLTADEIPLNSLPPTIPQAITIHWTWMHS